MTDAWFSPETAKLFSYLSLLSLCSLLSIPARKGHLRGLAVGMWNSAIGLAVLLVMAGGLAMSVGQPAHVVRALLISGLVVGLTFVSTRRVLTRGYEEAELRRTVAADL